MPDMNRQVLLASRPQGPVTEDNFRIVDAPLPVAGRGRSAGEESSGCRSIRTCAAG